jgi:hypothetical protein
MSGWRFFFTVAAIFNFAAGLPFLIAPDAALASFGLPVPEDLLYHRVTGVLIVCFGIGYGFVAREPERNRAIVWIGTLGKAGVIVLLAQAWLAGAISLASFAVALGDLAFVIGFLVFLSSKRSAA